MNFDKLTELEQEFDQLNSQLMDPDALAKQGNFEQVSSRFAQLDPIIRDFREYKNTQTQITDSEELIKTSDDPEMQALAEEDVKNLRQQLDNMESKLNEMLAESDPNDVRNAIVEIRAGAGGEESALFAAEIYRMYLRYSETKGWKIEQISSNKTGNGGYKEIIFFVKGNSVFGNLKYENGVHRVQRVPATESSGRVHTSAISVVVLPEVDDVSIEIKDEDIKVDVYRSSGPGGQSVNTTDSAVRITHEPTGIVVTCQDGKSQHQNRATALQILRSKLYEIEQEKQAKELSDARKESIKSGDRSAKIRTYNFPQSRVTDHRIKQSWHNLSAIMDGDIEEVIATTKSKLQAED